MSKKLNFGEIRTKELGIMSTFNVTCKKLDALSLQFRKDKKAITDRIAKILEERKSALENGMSVDEMTVKYSTTEENAKLNALTEKYQKEKEPLSKTIEECLTIIPSGIYEAYKLAMDKGELSELTKAVNTFLSNLGVITPEKATSKFAQCMAIRISGMRKATAKDKKAGHFVSNKAEREFKELFMLAFLEHVVVEKGVVDMDETGALTMHKFDNAPAA